MNAWSIYVKYDDFCRERYVSSRHFYTEELGISGQKLDEMEAGNVDWRQKICKKSHACLRIMVDARE